MKNAIFIALALAAMFFSSCKKDYTCTCTDNVGNSVIVLPIHATRSQAKNACNNFQNYSGNILNCTLK